MRVVPFGLVAAVAEVALGHTIAASQQHGVPRAIGP